MTQDSPLPNGDDQQRLLHLTDALDLRSDHLILPRLAMWEVGAAAQTLGGVYRMCGNKKSTFAFQSTLFRAACVPERTGQVHLNSLMDHGWLEHCGRGKFSAKSENKRRSVTYRLSDKALSFQKPYAILPRGLALMLRTWSQRAVAAVLAARISLVEAVEENGVGSAYDREWASLKQLEKETGLGRQAIIAAKQALLKAKLVVRDEYGQIALNEEVEFAPAPAYLPVRAQPDTPVVEDESCADQGVKPAPGGYESCAHPSVISAPTGCDSCADGGVIPALAMKYNLEVNLRSKLLKETIKETPEVNTAAGGAASGFSKLRIPGQAFREITEELLRNHADLLDWLERSAPDHSEADLLRVFGAAVRALEIGNNPAAVFVAIVRDNVWPLISQQQEDRARLRLKALNGHKPRKPVYDPTGVDHDNGKSISEIVASVLKAKSMEGEIEWQQ